MIDIFIKFNAMLIFLQQDYNIEDKLKNAPQSYKIVYAITSYLPFVLLVAIAWFIYYKAKNRKDLDD